MLLMYLCIMIGGFGFLLFSLIFGVDHDAEVDHDFDVDHDLDHDVDHDTDSGPHHRWFSLKVISCFATGFGAVGAVIRGFGGGTFWSLLGAVTSGIVMAVLTDFLILLFLKQQASSQISIQQLVGKTGEVTLTIKPRSFGEVTVSHQGQRFSGRAQCPKDLTIPQGSSVKILRAEGSTFIVEPGQAN